MMKHVPSSVCFCTHCKRYTGYRLKDNPVYFPIFLFNGEERYITIEKRSKVAICKECGNEMELFGLTNNTIKLQNFSSDDILKLDFFEERMIELGFWDIDDKAFAIKRKLGLKR